MFKYYFKRLIFFAWLFIIHQTISGQRVNENDSCSAFCPIDLNKDTVYYKEVPNRKFQLEVLPSIFKINLENTRAYLNYTIPFDTLVKTTGLTLIFGKLLPTCCDCNSNKICASDVQFRKILGTNCASFIWKTNSNKSIVKDTTIGHYKYEIKLAPTIRGIATIAPNLLKLKFSDDFIRIEITDLSQTIKGKSKIIINYSIQGVESSAWKGIIYPVCIKPFKVPNLPFYIQPK